MKIKKGDNVIVLTGKDKGKSGSVLKVIPGENKVVVDGINKKKKHIRSRARGAKGQVVEISLPIHASNVKLKSDAVAKPKKAKK